jgi:hypothetical protein
VTGVTGATGPGVTRDVTAVADATSITPTTTADSTIIIQHNTQVAGTLTINAPSANANGRGLLFRIKCDNAQTLAFNGIYRAPSGLALPTSIAAGKTTYVAFVGNSTDSKWDLSAVIGEY